MRERALVNVEVSGPQFKEMAAHLHTVVFALLAQREGRPRLVAREAGALHTHAPGLRFCPGCGPLTVSAGASAGTSLLLQPPPPAAAASAGSAAAKAATTPTAPTTTTATTTTSPSLAHRSRQAAIAARAEATAQLPMGWSEIVNPATGETAWWHSEQRRTVFSRPVE